MEMGSKNVLTGPKLLFPVPDVSLGRYLYQCLSSHGDRIAQVDAVTGETRTYADIMSAALSVAYFLYSRGIRSGDVVGICSENSLDFILPVIGTLFTGATCAPLNPNYTLRELHHAMDISKPQIMFCSEQPLENIDKILCYVGFLKDIVVFGSSVSDKHIPFRSILWNKSNNFQPFDGHCKDLVAAILCSSGTTGLSKGVMLTHRNILHAFRVVSDSRYADMRPSDTLLMLLPMFHAYMFVNQLIASMVGLKAVVINKFEEHMFLRTIEKHKVTLLYLVPRIIVFMAKADVVSRYDLSSVRDILCGAAPLKQVVESLAAERLALHQIRQGYGLTEATLALTISPNNKKKMGSSGILVPETECKVVDMNTGQSLGPREAGELCFRGLGIMKGYCGNPQATAASFDSDGFLHTGDVGYYDEDGFFYIVDRLKELIKYKGYQVPPAELEAVLLTHPAIKDAAVTAVPDLEAGELPLAFVVKQPGARVTKDEIIKHVAGQVSPPKRLRGGVMFIDSIPKTPSGKILRRYLKKLIKSNM